MLLYWSKKIELLNWQHDNISNKYTQIYLETLEIRRFLNDSKPHMAKLLVNKFYIPNEPIKWLTDFNALDTDLGAYFHTSCFKNIALKEKNQTKKDKEEEV